MRILSLMLCAVALIFCASPAHAKGSCAHQHQDYGHKICEKEKLTKIFPDPEQIVVNQDGIFVYTANKKLLLGKFIAVENGEIYVAVPQAKRIPKRGPCGLHREYHKRPRGCGGCGVLLCPMNCTCFD